MHKKKLHRARSLSREEAQKRSGLTEPECNEAREMRPGVAEKVFRVGSYLKRNVTRLGFKSERRGFELPMVSPPPLALHRALGRMAGLVFLLIFSVLAGACQRNRVGAFFALRAQASVAQRSEESRLSGKQANVTRGKAGSSVEAF